MGTVRQAMRRVSVAIATKRSACRGRNPFVSFSLGPAGEMPFAVARQHLPRVSRAALLANGRIPSRNDELRCIHARFSNMTDSNDRDRDRQSLRDLAKMSQQTGPLSSSAPASVRNMPPPSSGVTDNSGLIDLGRVVDAIRATSEGKSEASLPPVAASADSVLPLGSQVPLARATMPSNLEATPLSPSVELIESSLASKAPIPASVTQAAVAPATAASKLPLVALALVLVGAGAFVATRKSAPEAQAPGAIPAQEAVVQAAPPVVKVPTAVAEAVKPEAVKPEAVKPEAVAKAASPGAKAAASSAGSANAVVAAEPKGVPKATATKQAKSFADEMAAAVTGTLQNTHVAEVAAGSAPAGPATGNPKPTQGQVQAAFAKVKGAAHNCLVGQELEIKTSVLFGSDGKVQRVSVTNAPASDIGACIEGAVSKASVPAFTDPTFSAPLTVR